MRKRMIRTKMKEMEESLKLVEDNLPHDYQNFSQMGLAKDGIYKNIEFCIQQVIDICAIINSDLELGIPSEETDIIENLVESEILDADLGQRIKRMRGFRNILVHRYGKIDDERAFHHIQNGIQDFRLFIQQIKKVLSQHK